MKCYKIVKTKETFIVYLVSLCIFAHYFNLNKVYEGKDY